MSGRNPFDVVSGSRQAQNAVLSHVRADVGTKDDADEAGSELRDALQRDERQVLPSRAIAHAELDGHPRPSSNKRLGRSAR